jgi:hypothetical protein
MKDKDTLLLEDAYNSIITQNSQQTQPTPQEVLDLIKSLPDADKHIFQHEGKWEVTNEWIVGGFAGRSFVGETPEEATQQLIEYLNRHIGHKSMVGHEVTKSGWPNLERVKEYLQPEVEYDIDYESEREP